MDEHCAVSQVVVDVPRWLAFDLWAHDEELPRFLGDLKHVEQLDGDWSRWELVLEGELYVCHVETTDAVPMHMVARRSKDAPWRHVRVSFEGPERGPTRVRYELDWHGSPPVPDPQRWLREDLARFAAVAASEA